MGGGAPTGAVMGFLAGRAYLGIVGLAAEYVGGTFGHATIEAYAGTFSLGHGGLWLRLDNCHRSVFAATTKELASVHAHPQLLQWSDDKLDDKIKDRKLPDVSDVAKAKAWTYGQHRVIKKIWV